VSKGIPYEEAFEMPAYYRMACFIGFQEMEGSVKFNFHTNCFDSLIKNK
jgi:hypothetical protein